MKGAALINVQVYNFLVHYGEDAKNNLFDLFEDGLKDLLYKGEHWGKTNVCYVQNIKYIENKDSIFLTGYFHRSIELEWEYVPDKYYNAKRSPGSVDVMPRARFVIDLVNHRLFWITNVGRTYSPRASHFQSYVKSNMLKILRTKYSEIGEIEYQSLLEKEGEKEPPSWREFKGEFLIKNKIRNDLMSIKLVPLVAHQSIEKYFKEDKYLITSVKFRPHISNPTNDDFADLFVDTAKFASSAQGKIDIDLKATDTKAGINKEAVKKVVDENRKKQLLDLTMNVVDSENEKEKPIKVTNKVDADSSNEATDISVKFQFEMNLNSAELQSKIMDKLDALDLNLSGVAQGVLSRCKKIFKSKKG